MADLASVTTTDGMTMTSNTEAEAGMRDALASTETPDTPPPTETPAELPDGTPDKPAPIPPPLPEAASSDRNPDGTFKAKGKPRNDPQARIDQAIARQKEAERRAEDAERRAREYEARATQPPQPEPKPQPAERAPTQAEWARYKALPDAPHISQFDDYNDYVMALSMFVADKRGDEREAKARDSWQREQQTRAEQQRATAWMDKLTAAKARIPDFDQRFNPDVPANRPMLDVITDSPLGPELMLYLSEHPEESQRLSTLHPSLVFREMGKIEARLEAAHSGPALTAPAVSRARPPIKPVGSSPPATDPLEITGEESYEEHARKMNALEARQRRARVGR